MHFNDHAALGVRRLSIIDLAGGHQPMMNETGNVIAVQNGEIYNFEELRRDLIRLGHRFTSRSDTEVLPHGYEEWGLELIPRLRGMFALAIWDERDRSLILARDRFGKKPIMFAALGENFVFGSEIQAVLAHPLVGRQVDAAAISDYLTFGYVPAPRTAFASIRKVMPGHLLRWRHNSVETHRYWTARFAPKLNLSLEDAASELRLKIDEAVRLRLISDVPIGAFLSGGLDSSTVVAFMARHSTKPVRTFSIGFRDRRYDESPYARTVAQAFGTDHQEFVVDAGETDVLPMLVRHLGEPFADSSIVPTYQVARMTRSQVTVALTGDGGDEIFGGYDRYKAAEIVRMTLARIPTAFTHAAARIGSLAPGVAWTPRAVRRLGRFLSALDLPPDQRFLQWTGYFTGQSREAILGDRLLGIDHGYATPLTIAADVTGASEGAERFMASDMLLNLPGDLLVKMDIATMASSLEARSPLLDHELVEFVARLPVAYKVSPFRSKILLRKAMTGILPDTILARGKMGFSAPVASWLRGPLRALFGDTVPSGLAVRHGYVRGDTAERMFEDHSNAAADRSLHLWNLLMLELWFREFAPDFGP